ncbi:50S ribosomal protein L1 [Candidatus Karelsulcia muelleri]|uniref:50S ribosomal protein L1 n=1 Tax=Candidatus Karelsulcia muelleri TaxID=336810 RepID=UPI001FF5F4F7|nr:50S ribosomal protein L1 [Candidatus Karelsulcia muelleri]UOQ32951.1 50S ribosomal protein L1 [Candidatus Karelsulcia muelleri]
MKNKTIKKALYKIKKNNKKNINFSIDIDIILNIDYKNQNIPIREAIPLPYGNGKKYKILALIEKEKRKELYNIKEKNLKIGYKKYIEKIKTKFIKFDIIIATPKTMQLVSQLGKILGPKGLMPNPVLGTVTNSPQKIINEIINGKIFLKSDRYGIIHSSIGRINFQNQQLISNIQFLINYLKRKKNNTLKGELIKKIYLSSTMGTSYLIY